jgi:hypothetical protein
MFFIGREILEIIERFPAKKGVLHNFRTGSSRTIEGVSKVCLSSRAKRSDLYFELKTKDCPPSPDSSHKRQLKVQYSFFFAITPTFKLGQDDRNTQLWALAQTVYWTKVRKLGDDINLRHEGCVAELD